MTDLLHLTDDIRAGGVMTNVRSMKTFDLELGASQRITEVNPDSILAARALQADVIVVHFSLAWRKLPFLVALRALNRNALLILQEHHYSPEHFEDEPEALKRFRLLVRSTFPLFDRVLAVSNAQARWYEELGSTPTGTAPPLANLDDLLELPEKIKSSHTVVGVSGRLEQAKGIDLLLAAIRNNNDRCIHFLIAGDGELRKAVKKTASNRENVSYFGCYEHPQTFLSRCDQVAIPSRLDTFGLSALEAKAAGKPIVVTQTCGLTEQAKNCGVVVERNSPESLLRGISQLKRNNKNGELGRSARSSAKTHNMNSLEIWRQQLQQKR